MLPPLASTAMLEALLGVEFPAADLPRAEAVLRSASSLVRDEAGKTWLVDGILTDPHETAVTIALDVAKRAWENPQGLISEQYPEYVWRADSAEPGVYLTAAEQRRLRRLRGSSGLWVQQTTRRGSRCDGVFVDDQFGCDPFLIADCY